MGWGIVTLLNNLALLLKDMNFIKIHTCMGLWDFYCTPQSRVALTLPGSSKGWLFKVLDWRSSLGLTIWICLSISLWPDSRQTFPARALAVLGASAAPNWEVHFQVGPLLVKCDLWVGWWLLQVLTVISLFLFVSVRVCGRYMRLCEYPVFQ